VAHHSLDRREAPRTHRDLIADYKGLDGPIALARTDLRASCKTTAASIAILATVAVAGVAAAVAIAVAPAAVSAAVVTVVPVVVPLAGRLIGQTARRQERTHQSGCLQHIPPRTNELQFTLQFTPPHAAQDLCFASSTNNKAKVERKGRWRHPQRVKLTAAQPLLSASQRARCNAAMVSRHTYAALMKGGNG
jgi:hypothetical protein